MNKEAAVQIAMLIKQAGLTPTQAILLVKASHDVANVKARMEKTANKLKRLWSAGNALLRPSSVKPTTPAGPTMYMPRQTGAPSAGQAPTSMPGKYDSGQMFTSGQSKLPVPSTPFVSTPATPPSPKKGWSNMGRLRAAGALGLGGTVAGAHLDNASDNTVGRTWTNAWLNPLSEEDVFMRNQQKVEQELNRSSMFRKSLKDQLAEAHASGDIEKYKQLTEQMNSGDFGGSSFSLWGLNPWANRSAKGYMERASGAQKTLQDKYNTEMGSVGITSDNTNRVAKLTEQLNSGRLSKPQAEAVNNELALLKQRMEMKPGAETDVARKIKERMSGADMGFVPWKAPGATKPTTTTPGGSWNTAGPRPGGYGQGFANSRYDFRPQPQRDPWESVLSNNNSIFGG